MIDRSKRKDRICLACKRHHTAVIEHGALSRCADVMAMAATVMMGNGAVLVRGGMISISLPMPRRSLLVMLREAFRRMRQRAYAERKQKADE
ncbi:hypothetical protein LH128_24097 [Sphingomonas sp. LH128]|nr:hypothetical protein LH128_24097 [Sphingomonas sp. LH128]